MKFKFKVWIFIAVILSIAVLTFSSDKVKVINLVKYDKTVSLKQEKNWDYFLEKLENIRNLHWKIVNYYILRAENHHDEDPVVDDYCNDLIKELENESKNLARDLLASKDIEIKLNLEKYFKTLTEADYRAFYYLNIYMSLYAKDDTVITSSPETRVAGWWIPGLIPIYIKNPHPDFYPGYGYEEAYYIYKKGREVRREYLGKFWKQEEKTLEKDHKARVYMKASEAAELAGNVDGLKIIRSGKVYINGKWESYVEVEISTKETVHITWSLLYQKIKVWFELFRRKDYYFWLGSWEKCGEFYQIIEEPAKTVK